MKYGDLEVTASLNREGSAYSSQEDILLKVHFQNLEQKDTLMPYMATHPAKWDLKNVATGDEKSLDYTPKPQPGMPRTTALPEAQLASGQAFTYSLFLQSYLGFLQPGKYQVRYKLNSPKVPFATDWMDFSVLEKQVDAYTVTQSMPGLSRCLHLAWRDRGAKPARLLLQRSYIGQNRPLMPRVFVVGEGDTASVPVASYAPVGREPDAIWVGWMVGDSLRLARVGGNDSQTSAAFPAPKDSKWEVVPFLNYFEAAGGENSSLQGAIIGRSAQGVKLSCFELRNQKDFKWSHTFQLPGGEILAIRLIPISPELRYFIWARHQDGQLHIEALPWEEKIGLGKTIALGNTKVSSSNFKSFDANAATGKIVWGAVFQEAALKTGGTVSLWSHSLDLTTGRPSAGVPRQKSFPSKGGPLAIALKFDSESRPWILQRDVHGSWVQSAEFDEPIAVESPKGSKFETLFFRRGNLPRVLLYNPDTGFEVRNVDFPGSGKKVGEEAVEDNEGVRNP